MLKKNFKSFIFLLIYIYSLSACDIYASALPAEKKMGLEVETSAIKIRLPLKDRIGFIISRGEGDAAQDLWMIEDDTLDKALAKTEHAGFNKNLECKTLGGISNRDEVVAIARDMKGVLEYLHGVAMEESEINPGIIPSTLPGGRILVKEGCRDTALIKSIGVDNVVRPQITYQLPLRLMPRVFERLRDLGHKGIKDFLDALDSSKALEITPAKISEKLANDNPLIKNAGHTYNSNLFFKSHFAGRIPELPEGKVKGFCYLFLYYWYELFNNKEYIPGREPGPKQFLGIMSRVPLSQIFDTLNPSEKAEFQSLFSGIIEGSSESFRLLQYADNGEYEGREAAPVPHTLTLREWYESIVNGERDKWGGRNVDLLSPPPGFEGKPEPYSMGLLDIHRHSDRLPLIEVRGYAKIRHLGSPLTFSNIDTFIQQEANWFFEVEGTGEAK